MKRRAPARELAQLGRGDQLATLGLRRSDLALAEQLPARECPVQRDCDRSQLGGVAEAAGADAVNAETFENAPAQGFGGGDVQAGLAVEERALLEQTAGHEAFEPRVGPAAPHREALHHVLGAGHAEPPVQSTISASPLSVCMRPPGRNRGQLLQRDVGQSDPMTPHELTGSDRADGWTERAKRASSQVVACSASASPAARRGASIPRCYLRHHPSVPAGLAKDPPHAPRRRHDGLAQRRTVKVRSGSSAHRACASCPPPRVRGESREVSAARGRAAPAAPWGRPYFCDAARECLK